MSATSAVAADRLCDASFEDCRAPIIDLIRNETSRIDVAFWFMSDARYSNEIIKRWQAGVDVRVIMDLRANDAHPENAQILDQLRTARIPMRNKTGGGILHNKMMLFDAQGVVEFSGANYSPYGFVPIDPYRNYEDEVILFVDDVESPSVVDSFRTHFEDLWTDTTRYANYANITTPLERHYSIFPKDPELNFPAAESFRNRAVAAYDAETSRIDATMFRITDRAHTDAIIRAVERGIPVRLLTDKVEYRNADRLWHSWNVDRMYMAGLAARAKGQPGIDIRLDAHENVMHQKSVQLYSQGLTIFGSSNWTSPSAGGSSSSQDEHNYFTTRVPFFNWFTDQFDRKWNNSNPVGAIETEPFQPLPPDKAQVVSPANQATGVASPVPLTWYAGPWAHTYDVYLGTDPANLKPVVIDAALGPSESASDNQRFTLADLNGGTTYYWYVVSKTMARQTRTSSVWSFTTSGVPTSGTALPAPWSSVDIGTTVAGHAGESGGTFTVSGAGADTWGTSDAFHFVYRPLDGDGSIVARVASVENVNAWTKAGVMIRQSLDAGSAHAFMVVSAGKGLSFQRRTADGGESSSTSGGAGVAPYFVKLTRAGATITAAVSADGSSWRTVGSDTIPMGTSIFVGLAVSSHVDATRATATFDGVTVTSAGGGDVNPPTVSITAPADGAVVSGTATVSADASDDTGVTRVELWVDAVLRSTVTTSPYHFTWDTTTMPDGSHTLEARAFDAAGNAGSSGAIVVQVQNGQSGQLPAPWSQADVGAVGVPGSASEAGGAFTVDGNGADIWGTADAFHFVYRTLAGDGTVVARVASLQNTDAWTKAGVMIRESLDPGSRHALMLVSAGKGLAFQRRTTTGGTSTNTSGGAGVAPAWVKLVRTGTSFTASTSTDGSTWRVVGSATISMTQNVLVGLAVTSHTTSTLARAVFDGVSVTEASLPAGWADRDIGAVGVAGSASESAGTFTVNGSGADVWGTADAFNFAYQSMTGDGEIIARVATVQFTDKWSKAGVMMRETLDASSAQAFMLVSAGRGLAFQRRTAPGGDSTNTDGGAGTAPTWVRLVRSGTSFSAYTSADGTTWRLVGTDAIAMGSTIYVGLAVTSHNNPALCRATFDSMTIR
ncbi:MAG TPA: phospholipase D-like domain-containing protein [Vicinamibacterales bacterium]